MKGKFQVVYITGGAGYVGARLVPRLLNAGYEVRVLDLFIYGEQVFADCNQHPKLKRIKGDIRNRRLLEETVPGADALIHLACISNDPSFELNPQLGKSINFDCFPTLVSVAKDSGVNRFVYASSSSVYGVKSEKNVTEELTLEPLTDYSKFKAMCEEVLLKARAPGFEVVVLRPATVCGYSTRLRLDLSVNILTNNAVNNRKIVLFGGSQMRPNIHISDMCALYQNCLDYESSLVDGQIFNAGYENHTIADIGGIVKSVVGEDVEVVVQPTNDNRSYHISSEKIELELGFKPTHTIRNAVEELVAAFKEGRIPDPMNDPRYYNIKMMQKLGLS